MARTAREQVDKDRSNVIDALIRDPLCSIDSLSEKCNLSKQQVYRILRSLEADGVISGSPVVLNLSKVGKKRFVITARRSGKPTSHIATEKMLYSDSLSNRLKENNLDVIDEEIYACTGDVDMVTIFIANDNFDANKYLGAIKLSSGDYFEAYTISEVMFTIRKNIVLTPEKSKFIEYMTDISDCGFEASEGSDAEDASKKRTTSKGKE